MHTYTYLHQRACKHVCVLVSPSVSVVVTKCSYVVRLMYYRLDVCVFLCTVLLCAKHFPKTTIHTFELDIPPHIGCLIPIVYIQFTRSLFSHICTQYATLFLVYSLVGVIKMDGNVKRILGNFFFLPDVEKLWQFKCNECSNFMIIIIVRRLADHICMRCVACTL